ncbi:U-box domain-containing protein 15-like isoform X1 [Sesamum indicum]|uniref:RING-type E3 ubiquitin transferase n=2 Tax=Sesamum indicum TaxID=4182 RepID=A0A6I9TSH6_SESIN|nr:U-box domain-containing protein 15-like isoform X1 [Sesamum indicum]
MDWAALMEGEGSRIEGKENNNNISILSSCGNGNGVEVVKEMMEVIEKVGSYAGFRKTQRKECLNLVRRLKLLTPLLEEIKELHADACHPQPHPLTHLLINLNTALLASKKLLKTCNSGSKIFLALESEALMSRFHAVYDKLNQALYDMPYEKLGISEEVREQVELMRMQLSRAKRRTETQDMELAMDMMVVFSKNEDDRNADSAIIERLAKKLELHTMAELKTETMAVRKLVKAKGGAHNKDTIQQVVDLLAKFKQIAGIDENSVLDGPALLRCLEKSKSLLIPHEFLCPISLEIMADPVIIATGQTYERESIQRWLNSGHRTCPKTGQKLNYLTVAPNFALRNLIQQWCERNNYDLPKKEISDDPDIASSPLAEEISSLIQNLYSSHVNLQRDAIFRIRMLSKESPDSRVLIANSGGIPPLVYLLSCTDSEIQQHIVTALLNLSLDEANKRLIAREGAIPAIIQVLRNGTQEAKENSAAALFSLSILDENKVLVGCSNGIPPLVDLLRNGTNRGKKDAATALFSLVLNQANRSRAIKAGIIPPLLHLLEDKSLDMVDEALSILLLIASHPEGRNEIGRLSFIQMLVEIVRDGTPKNKECATAVILELGSNNSSCLLAALQYGVYDHLVEITRCGTTRAQRKANSLLHLMSKNEHIPFVPRK